MVKDHNEKMQIFDNLIGILEKKIPPPPADAGEDPENIAIKHWTNHFDSLASDACVTTIVINTISSFVGVKATFTKKQFAAEEMIELEVYVRLVFSHSMFGN